MRCEPFEARGPEQQQINSREGQASNIRKEAMDGARSRSAYVMMRITGSNGQYCARRNETKRRKKVVEVDRNGLKRGMEGGLWKLGN